jgi:transposase
MKPAPNRPERAPTGGAPTPGKSPHAHRRGLVPDPEVAARGQRRRFTNDYKLRIVKEADQCKGHGEVGALLRREGLYSSHLATWRSARDRGELTPGKSAKKRGPKPKAVDPNAKRIAELELENAKLKARAEKAEFLVEMQKKMAALLRREEEDET